VGLPDGGTEREEGDLMAGNVMTWTKKMKDHAKSKRVGLFAYGYSDVHLSSSEGGKFGHALFHTPMEPTKALGLMWFTYKVHHGMTPAEAFAAVDWEKGELKSEEKKEVDQCLRT
jgi:hypothetical protein